MCVYIDIKRESCWFNRPTPFLHSFWSQHAGQTFSFAHTYILTSPASPHWSRLKGYGDGGGGIVCWRRVGDLNNDCDRKNVGCGGEATGGAEGTVKRWRYSGVGGVSWGLSPPVETVAFQRLAHFIWNGLSSYKSIRNVLQDHPKQPHCAQLCGVGVLLASGGGGRSVYELNGSNLLTNFVNSMQILVLINCLEHKTFKQKESVKREARKHPHALPRQTPSSPSLSLSNLRSECLRGSVGIYTSAAIFALSFHREKIVSNDGRKKIKTQMFIPSRKTPKPEVKHQSKHS